MKRLVMLFGLFLSLGVLANSSPLPVESDVDVTSFVGKWYTISSLPQFFTRKCVGQSAEYGIINEKTISVHNVCYKESGKTKDIFGKGVIEDAPNNARLTITFDSFWTKLFRVKGDYNIIKLSEGYDSVMVGSSNRKSLWIMSRTPALDPVTLQDYKTLARTLGFSTEKLRESKY